VKLSRSVSEYSEIVFQKYNGLCATWNHATTYSTKSDYSDTLLESLRVEDVLTGRQDYQSREDTVIRVASKHCLTTLVSGCYRSSCFNWKSVPCRARILRLAGVCLLDLSVLFDRILLCVAPRAILTRQSNGIPMGHFPAPAPLDRPERRRTKTA
jgi:hypothetical protein